MNKLMNIKFANFGLLSLTFTLILTLSSCGQKGPLYILEEQTQTVEASSKPKVQVSKGSTKEPESK